MKILHVIGQLRTGGAENVAMNILRYSDAKRFQNDFLVFDEQIGNYEQEAMELGATIHRIAKPNDSYIKFCKNLKKLVIENKYDIVHTHTLLNNGLVAISLKNVSNVKIISHAHSTSSGKFNESFFYHIYTRKMKKYIKNYCDIKLACGKEAGKYLYENEEFEVINNGIDLDKYKYTDSRRAEIRNELNINEESFVLGHVGRLEKVKNHEYLLQLFARFISKNENSMLLVIGTGERLSELMQLSCNLNIENNVLFLGNRKDVDKIYSAIDVLVFPSLYEGIPLTLIEAQASGLPCIVSDTVSFESKINNNVSFFSLDNPNSWLDKMKEVNLNAENRELKYDMFYKSGFDIKNEIKKLEKIYLELS